MNAVLIHDIATSDRVEESVKGKGKEERKERKRLHGTCFLRWKI